MRPCNIAVFERDISERNAADSPCFNCLTFNSSPKEDVEVLCSGFPQNLTESDSEYESNTEEELDEVQDTNTAEPDEACDEHQ
ncbi:hypothetical protein YC2023_102749 [Brassica napus]